MITSLGREALMDDHNRPGRQPTLVVGVTPGQSEAVIGHAAKLACKLGARLVCAFVDTGQVTMFEGADGTLMSMPIDPDVVEEPSPFPEALQDLLAGKCAAKQVPVEFRRPVGEPAIALSELADQVEAYMIIVGTRRPGIRAGIAEFLGGSVAAHLSHRQPRPVIVVPQTPTRPDEALPWDDLD
jgi:nucleotide-binding universal stress UspA family protein